MGNGPQTQNFKFFKNGQLTPNGPKFGGCFFAPPLFLNFGPGGIAHRPTRPAPILLVNLLHLDICLAVHHSITFLLLPTWYTDFLFIHTNYIKLNSSARFESNPLIIKRSTTQIVHVQPLVSSLSSSDRLVHPLRQECVNEQEIYVSSW